MHFCIKLSIKLLTLHCQPTPLLLGQEQGHFSYSLSISIPEHSQIAPIHKQKHGKKKKNSLLNNKKKKIN